MESAAGVSWSMTKQFCGYTDEDASAFSAGVSFATHLDCVQTMIEAPAELVPLLSIAGFALLVAFMLFR